MKKKLMIGALALSATAVLGVTGCDNNENPDNPGVPTYTVTFDHDNNPNTAPVDVVKFNQGDIGLTRLPAVPELNGFAGVWDSYTLNNSNITVTAHYGEGTEVNPYMIATALQFQRFVDEYTQYVDTTYTREPATNVQESESLVKYVNYKTISLVYTRNSTSENWKFDHYDTTNKVYFKLIADIDMQHVPYISSTNLTGRYFSGCLDGQGFNIKNFDGSMFGNTYGAMIESVADTTFKNLNIHLGNNLASLVSYAVDGDNVFENIVIHNSQETPTFVSVDDNNESPFIVHAFGEDTTLTFKNCINKANMVMSADYCGLFLGGYAKNIKALTFEGCVNEANIQTSGSVGMLIGNGSYSPVELNVNNECKNLGTIQSKKQSNILVSHAKGSGMIASKIAEYATEDRLQNYESETVGSFTALDSQYKGSIEGTDITVSNKQNLYLIESGEYQLILSAYAQNASGENHMSLLTNIVIKATVEQGESYTFENAFLGVMDLNTYKNAVLDNKVDVDSLEASDWTKLEAYNGKYFIDEANGLYVIDFAQVEADYGLGENKLVINRTAAQLKKVVVVFNQETKDIEFIADFE